MAFALRGCHVVLTDKPDVLEHLEKSVAKNLPGNDHVSVAPFMWGTQPKESQLGCSTFDLVIATDPIYRMEQIEPFVHAGWSLCNDTSAFIVATGMPRCLTRVWDAFYARLEELFEVHQVIAPTPPHPTQNYPASSAPKAISPHHPAHPTRIPPQPTPPQTHPHPYPI